MIGQVAPSDSAEGETQQCLKYEILCWVDCMTAGIVPEFCSILEEASQLHFKSEIYLLQAWKKADLPQPMPTLAVSPILMAAMSNLSGGSRTGSMAVLLNQVVTKCLLYHDNPLPLAALVGYFQSTGMNSQLKDPLRQYARSLVAFGTVSESKREELLRRLVDSTFTEKSFHRKTLRLTTENTTEKILSGLLDGLSREDTVAATRQLLHILASSSIDASLRNNISLMRLLLPAMLQVRTVGGNILT